ncbi:hypothetical protein ABZX82_01835 [Streptomyces griseoflavus]|uniref:hypothetical protein n=1 Tax=Streptomyces griseoflavus TaxID=35619 RepID=UPI0033A0424B
MTGPYIHTSPNVTITATQWPPGLDTPGIRLRPGDWTVRITLPAPSVVPGRPDAVVLRDLLETALADLDRATAGPDAHLDDPDA